MHIQRCMVSTTGAAKGADMASVVLDELPIPTPGQMEALARIDRFCVVHRYGPRQRGLARGTGASSRSATAPFVDPLIGAGCLERRPRRQRNVRPAAKLIEKLTLQRSDQGPGHR